MTPRNREFRRSSWTDRPVSESPRSARSPASSPRASACASSCDGPAAARVSEPLLPLFLAAPPSRARRARSSSSCRTMPRPATRPKAPAGSSARTTSGSSPRAAFAGAAVSSRRRTSSVSAPARSRSWRRAGSSARLRSASRRRSPRRGAAGADRVARRGRARRGGARPSDLLSPATSGSPQAEERGQFAVRGGIVDVFPSTGREPVRLELFGDEIESLRAFSPFTQRTLHPLESATVYPAAERRLDLVEPMLAEDGEPAPLPDDLVAPLPKPDLVWQADEVAEVVREELGTTVGPPRRAPPDPAPGRPAPRFEAQRPAVAARGLAEAERDLLAFVKSGSRVVVTFAHRGEAQRTKAMLRRLDAVVLDPGDDLPDEPGLFFAVSPARRGFVLRDLDLILLPDTQVFRKRPPRADARIGRALQSFADLRTGDHVVHEDHGVGKLLGFETKTVAGVTRDYLFLAFRGDDRLYVPHEQIGKVSRYVGADGHAPGALEARRQGLADDQEPGPRGRARAGGRAARALRAAPAGRGRRLRGRVRARRATRGELRLRGDAGPAPGDRGGEGRPRDAAPDGPPRLRGRRLRKDRGRRARRLHRGGERRAGAPARADDDPRAAALEHLPRALPRPAGDGRDDLALPQARRREAGARGLRRGKGRRPHRHASRALAGRRLEESRPRDRRRGAAVRRRAEGAAAPAAARGGRARTVGDADPAHAAHVACWPARHQRHRDAAAGPPADPHARRRVRRGARPRGARARARARGPVLLPPQSRRVDRGGGRAPPPALFRSCASSSRTARCRNASSRATCSRSSPATRTCSSRRRSSSPGSTSRRRTR